MDLDKHDMKTLYIYTHTHVGHCPDRITPLICPCCRLDTVDKSMLHWVHSGKHPEGHPTVLHS